MINYKARFAGKGKLMKKQKSTYFRKFVKNNFNMKHIILSSLCLIILNSCTQEKPSQSKPDADDGWISLLNDDLSGWNQTGALEAEMTGNVLSLTATGDQQTGMLTTQDNHFDNFHLKLDIQSSDIQSSIFFRLNDQLESASELPGYTISIDANPDQLDPIGTIQSVARSTIPENFDAKQWNTLEVTA